MEPRTIPLFFEFRRLRAAPGNGNRAFTLIELLVVIIIIGVLVVAGVAKYQEFAEQARRKTCFSHMRMLEDGLAIWETANEILADNAKCAFGFTTRTGRITDTSPVPTALNVGVTGAIAKLQDPQPVVGGPDGLVNGPNSGPLCGTIRDDRIWTCPSALYRFYNGDISSVPDDYMDISGGGTLGIPHAPPIGLGGRYLCAVAGMGNRSYGYPVTNGGFPPGWIADAAVPPDVIVASPCVQPPFRVVICGCFGTFGTGNGIANLPGTSSTNAGGPVGPDGSALSRHSARW